MKLHSHSANDLLWASGWLMDNASSAKLDIKSQARLVLLGDDLEAY